MGNEKVFFLKILTEFVSLYTIIPIVALTFSNVGKVWILV